MKILYTPLMIVPSLEPAQRARILDAAGLCLAPERENV